jgi:hypothetical protein
VTPPSPRPAFAHEVFLVYADEDQAWAEGDLSPQIAPRDRIVAICDLKPGDLIPRYIATSVQQSRFTVLVVSSAFKKSPWLEEVQQMAQYLSLEEQRSRLITVNRDGTPLDLFLRVRHTINCKDADQSAAMLRKLREELLSPEPEPEEEIGCPYPGMKPFSQQSPFFFGRDKEIRQLLDVLDGQHRVFVIGVSGSGKSSLIFAGLAPELNKAAPRKWRIRTMRPGEKPLETLGAALECEGQAFAAAVAPILTQDPPAQKLLLVVDQSEELFTTCPQEFHLPFLTALNEIAALDNAAVLLTHKTAYEKELLALLKESKRELQPGERLDLAPLSGDRLRKAIVGPAEHFHVYVEPRLVDRLIADATERSNGFCVLPAIQETMVLLWKRRRYRYISYEAYDSIETSDAKGLDAALALKADSVLNRLDAGRQAIAMRIFLRLLQFGDDGRTTRRQQSLAAVSAAEFDRESFAKTVELLCGASLVVLSGGSGQGGTRIDISHDALIQHWPRVDQWTAQYRAAELTRRWLQSKAADWAEAGEGLTCLLERPELNRAKTWRHDYAVELTVPPKVDELIEASERWRWIRSALAVAGVALALGFAVIAWKMANRIRASEGIIAAPAEGVSGLRSAKAAVDKAGPQLEYVSRIASALIQLNADYYDIGDEIPERIAFSHDNKWLALSTNDAKIHLWGLAPGLIETEREGNLAAFGWDSRLAFVRGSVVTVVKPGSAAAPTFHDLDGNVEALAWSRDSIAVAVKAAERVSIRIWKPERSTAAEIASIATDVNSLSFNSEGKLLAAACEKGGVMVWRGLGPDWRQAETIPAGDLLAAVAFLPNSQELAVAGRLKSEITIWAPGRTKPLRSLKGHTEEFGLRGVNSIAVDDGGRTLASGGNDGSAWVWDATNGKPLLWVQIADAEMRRLITAVSQDGSRVAVAAPGRVYLSDTDPKKLMDKAKSKLNEYDRPEK